MDWTAGAACDPFLVFLLFYPAGVHKAGKQSARGLVLVEEPPDYQVSEEEQALADAGKLNIGYGSPEVERTKSQTVYWEDGGVFYTMISFDNTMTAEEFAGMAGEIIDLK